MMLRVRQMLAALVLGCASTTGSAGALYAVELALFSCPHCLSVESHISRVEDEIGDRFVFAPVPESEDDWAALGYYAARELNPKFARQVRRALFEGRQKFYLPLSNPQQVWELFEFSRLDVPFTEAEFLAMCESAQLGGAMQRLYRLLDDAPIEAVPAVVLVKDGSVREIIRKGEKTDVQFVDAVLRAVRQDG